MSYYDFPWFTSIWWIFALFILSLIAFHIAFVRIWKFNSIQWKQVDYFWVSLALLGILGNVEQIRTMVARNFVDLATSRAESSFQQIKSAAKFGNSGAVCRTFIRSEFSPPEEEMNSVQQQFDAQCEWFKELSAKLDATNYSKTEPLDEAKITEGQPLGGEPLAYKHLTESIGDFNQSISELTTLREKANMTWFHELIQFLGPSLLAIAVALRLTKVTGEVALERGRSRGA